MTSRPLYVGVGECRCKRIDVRLYFVPSTGGPPDAICASCLLERGYSEPEPRTAEDVLSVDGKLAWKSAEPLVHVGKLELGYGHTFEVTLDAHDQLMGWLHTHPDARNPNVLCQSFCAVRPLNGSPVHHVVCPDPLTLTPSLECRTCGSRGDVTAGKWEPL
jgi:hypothetical protein